MLFRSLNVVLSPTFIVKRLDNSSRTVVAVCAEETVPSTDLKTLILDPCLSTFNTFTFSDSIERISFSDILGYVKSPITEKYVTIPVTVALPTADKRLNLFVVTPTL